MPLLTTPPRIPPARYQFGQRVSIHWHEAELGVTEGTITGVNYDHRHGGEVLYTITEDNGMQTDSFDAGMLTPA